MDSERAPQPMYQEDRDVLTRPAPPPSATVAYGPSPEQVIDVYLPPPADGPAPVVVLWHGGFWRQEFDRTHLGPMATALAEEGFVVAVPEYRRVGGAGGWPHTFVDAATVSDRIEYLLAEVVPDRADPGRLAYVGHSAGGHLAVWAASRDRLPPGAPGRVERVPPVAGVLSLAGVLDLVEAHRFRLGEGATGDLLGGGLVEQPFRYACADPTLIGPSLTPVIMLHGDRDARVPISQSRNYQRLTGNRLEELPDTDHFAVIDPESAVWPQIPAMIRTLHCDRAPWGA